MPRVKNTLVGGSFKGNKSKVNQIEVLPPLLLGYSYFLNSRGKKTVCVGFHPGKFLVNRFIEGCRRSRFERSGVANGVYSSSLDYAGVGKR